MDGTGLLGCQKTSSAFSAGEWLLEIVLAMRQTNHLPKVFGTSTIFALATIAA